MKKIRYHVLCVVFYINLAGTHLMIEEGYWGSSPCSSDSHNGRDCSPNSSNLSHQPPSSPYTQFGPVYYPPQYERPGWNSQILHKLGFCFLFFFSFQIFGFLELFLLEQCYDEGYYGASATNLTAVPFVRVIKRRTTANKKERRRTQSINSAFTFLRDCIPNVPSDTKLSKVRLK